MRNFRLKSIILVIFLAPVLCLSHQATAQNRFVFFNWNNSNGLPQNTVNDLELDSRGFLWAATEEGLACFDGSDFTIVDQNSQHQLHGNNFYGLRNDGDTLWASARNNILSITQGAIKVYDCAPQLGPGSIFCLERWAGKTWAGASNGVLLRLEHGRLSPLRFPSIHSPIETLCATPAGLMIGTTRGLFLLNASGQLQAIPEMNDKGITTLTWWQNKLYVGTSEEGFYIKEGEQWQHYGREQGLNDLFVNCFTPLPNGSVYFGSRTAGYQVLTNGYVHTPDQGPYAHDGIKCMLRTNELLWLGTTASGLVQLKPARVNMLFAGDELDHDIILPLYEHADASLFVGTARNGLTVIRDGKKQTLTTADGLSSNLVVSIYGNADYTYIGTASGLDRYNMHTRVLDRHYTRKEGLSTNLVNAVFCDSKGRVWVSTRNGGVHWITDAGVQRVNIAGLGDDATVITMMEDHAGRIYLGTKGKGYFIYVDTFQTLSFDTHKNFPADLVYDIVEDAPGNIWFATDKGIVKYNGKEYLLFDKGSGLRSAECYTVIDDGLGYLWTSGNFGIQRIPLAELTEAVAKKKNEDAISAVLINSSDGMNNSETNGGIFPAGWKLKNGHIIFPTIEGVVDADPRSFGIKQHPLNLRLTSLRYADTTLTRFDRLHIPQGLTNIELRYTSIDFSEAEDINYFYRLRGLSDNWVRAGNRRVAYFSGLQPGNYHFEVRAEQYGKTSRVLSIPIEVDPFFYQTLWFKLLLVALIISGGVGAILLQKQVSRRKLNEQKAITRAQLTGQEKERQIIGTELHDSINQQLATAKLYLDFARSNEEMRLPMVEKGETVIQNVINEIRALCKSMIPPTLKDIGLVDALAELIGSYEQVSGFEIHFSNDAPLDDLDEDLRFSLFRIVQEQLNNVVKHAQASEVWVQFTMVEKKLQLLVRDNGRGMTPVHASSGLGLNNIRNRLQLFDGTMDIRTAPGQGFQMLIQIPCE